eukprot:72920_1
MTKCASCSKSNATKTCSACKSVSYCNIKCQRNHWKTHKKKCKLLSKRNSKAKSKPQKDSEEKPMSKDRNYRKIPITQNNQKNISAAQPLCSAVTLKERLNLLKQINDPEVESLVNILWKLYTNILNDGFSISSQYKRLNFKQIKKQFSRYPIFIDLLYDAGFKKSSNGKKLIFDIKDMKLLMKANKELNKRFSFFGQFNDDKNDYNFDKRDSLHSRILDDLEMEMKEFDATDDINMLYQSDYLLKQSDITIDYKCKLSHKIEGGCYIDQLLNEFKEEKVDDAFIRNLQTYVNNEQ